MRLRQVGVVAKGLDDLVSWYAHHPDGKIPSGALLKYEMMAENAREVLESLEDLVERCDGAEGVRSDGSNIQTIRAHAAIEKARGVRHG